VSRKITEPHPQDRLIHHLATVDKWSLKRIGQAIGGVTKQRISQRIHHLQGSALDWLRAKRPDPEKLIAVCDNSYSAIEASRKLGIGEGLLSSTLKQLELLQRYKTFWKVRRSERDRKLHKRRLIRIMRLVARHLGHTPSLDEMNFFAKKSKGRIPYHSSWVAAFGSYRNGQIAAGLTPNNRGGGKHTQKAS
jgi:hypothetical protein